jgi:2-polyprenyl-3-methyl-5-hydroxy-6-metoxy-1,4-benzoquinol methylase
MSVASHYDGSASTYADQYDPDKIWTNEEYPANYFRLQLVRQILQDRGVQSVYELGAGEGTPLVTLAQDGIRVSGNDLSPEMITLGKKNFADHGLDPTDISLLDVQNLDAVRAERERLGQFDAVMALGVIPHVENESDFIAAMDMFLPPGGTLILQFRNSLFSMFTFNRLTKELILDSLLDGVSDPIRRVVEQDLDSRLAVDKPPLRTRPTGDGYDQILSKFHNPFELSELVASFGYENLGYRWYNYHPTYPMIANQVDPTAYRQAQIDLEGDTGWRGMFMCSAGLIIATKA